MKEPEGAIDGLLGLELAEEPLTCSQKTRPAIMRVLLTLTCTPCPVSSHCTRAKRQARSLTLQPQAEYGAIQAARQRQKTDAFIEQYAGWAGIEGTISQEVRAFGLRQARYSELAKTHLQQVATATAITIRRLGDCLNEVPRTQTRCSPFAALAPVA